MKVNRYNFVWLHRFHTVPRTTNFTLFCNSSLFTRIVLYTSILWVNKNYQGQWNRSKKKSHHLKFSKITFLSLQIRFWQCTRVGRKLSAEKSYYKLRSFIRIFLQFFWHCIWLFTSPFKKIKLFRKTKKQRRFEF